MKLLCYLPFNEKYMVESTFIERFSPSLFHSMQFPRISHKDAWSKKLEYEALSSCNVETAALIDANQWRHSYIQRKSK